ncbi:hypothetical protein Gasu2_47950 [Galdieria sulphuraria]|nr:hypothetical protein Gasu2_47950 [Galdieria sulphuraria]
MFTLVIFWSWEPREVYSFERERQRLLSQGRRQASSSDYSASSREKLNMSLLWLSQFKSATGFSTEAFAFLEGLQERVTDIDIYQFDGEIHEDYVRNLNAEAKKLIVRHWMEDEESKSNSRKKNSKMTMFETDGIPKMWQTHLNYVDEIWIPSQFNFETFSRSGVDPSRLHIVPQAITQYAYDLPTVLPLKLPAPVTDKDFVFLSVFKWEPRKGIDILLDAYFREFDASDPVCLVILTRKGNSNSSVFTQKISRYVDSLGIPLYNRAKFLVLEPSLPTDLMPSLYRRANAFVLPSRGEGWGRPLMEAMLMNVPVIATNWSGTTEFLRDDTGYPISVERLEDCLSGELEAADQQMFGGQRWARPSASHLRKLFRYVMDHPIESLKKAKYAREQILTKYNPYVVADIVVEQLKRILVRLEMEGKRRNV